jgi:broad specificity phosphatase PhoE
MRAPAGAVIILIRHGQSTANAQGLLVGRSDPELTERGAQQALALHAYLEGVQEVWTSPLRRARATAALAFPGIEASLNAAFIEVDYGSLDGHPIAQVTSEQWRDFESDHTMALGNGESLSAVDQRVHGQLDALLADRASLLYQADRHLAIVSHVSPIKSAVAWALGVPGSIAWRMRLENGSLTMVGSRGHTPQLIRFNVVPALF